MPEKMIDELVYFNLLFQLRLLLICSRLNLQNNCLLRFETVSVWLCDKRRKKPPSLKVCILIVWKKRKATFMVGLCFWVARTGIPDTNSPVNSIHASFVGINFYSLFASQTKLASLVRTVYPEAKASILVIVGKNERLPYW
jgi:hypothetical protein